MENNGDEIAMEVIKDRRTEALGNLRVIPDEVICEILTFLSPRDVARLACVSSVMYIFCNEEPLWMSLCLNSVNGHLQFKGSWKKTTLIHENAISGDDERQKGPLQFDGFYSLFLYRRLYRRYTTLEGFSVDNGKVERKSKVSLEEFRGEYDGKKPVLLTGLADTWPARNTWTLDQLQLKYGDTPFKISQRSARKIKMKLNDYVAYMKLQHDEDPLYIFDEKFGEVAPGLLMDYEVPHLFQEDYFDVLNGDERPSFRWFIIGPERSGASWHVDPALTSAWNTLLCGRKRWALYPPGKVPLGVTVHVNDQDGDVNIDSPSSLQWWLEYYPLLPDEDKPIECTQLPGETIFVPSGWWHCVLNLETTVAVTQNFVNSTNFEFVCLDMTPGYRHKGVCRAGLLAVDDSCSEDVDKMYCDQNCQDLIDVPSKEKGLKMHHTNHENAKSHAANCCSVWSHDLPYEISFLSEFLDEDRDHYNSFWSSSNCIGQREMREWLWKLWSARPGIRDLIWKGACLALNAGRWFDCVSKICDFHNLPSPKDDDKLPVGTGSNPLLHGFSVSDSDFHVATSICDDMREDTSPFFCFFPTHGQVYVIDDNVIKIYVEGGVESSFYCLGTELEFYRLLCEVKSFLKEHVPDVLASGFISLDNGSYSVVPWDGKFIPDRIIDCNLMREKCEGYSSPFGLWSKMLLECKTAGLANDKANSSSKSMRVWPYIMTKRCKGKIFAELRESLSWEDTLNLASFLGEKLHHLHVLPLPKPDYSVFANIQQQLNSSSVNHMEIDSLDSPNAADWKIFLHTITIRRKDVIDRLSKWGSPIPKSLIDKVDEYLPDDFDELLSAFEGEASSWIHSDIMDDNVFMEPSSSAPACGDSDCVGGNGSMKNGDAQLWKPYILDFSDLSIGDPILDLIPIHLDIFKGDTRLLKQLLSRYKLPLLRNKSEHNSTDKIMKFRRASYRAMCYCIVHEENVLGAIFGIWEDLKIARSWEEVERQVWGVLDEYMESS